MFIISLLLIRPRILPNESLASYIYRVCDANFCKISWLFEPIKIPKNRIYEILNLGNNLESHYVQADETIVTVVNSKGADSKAKKYMWLYKTGAHKDPVILYDYQKTGSSSCPKEFLKVFLEYCKPMGIKGTTK